MSDERYLKSQDGRLGKIIQPRLMDDSMGILENHCDVVLMADCKRLSKGFPGFVPEKP